MHILGYVQPLILIRMCEIVSCEHMLNCSHGRSGSIATICVPIVHVFVKPRQYDSKVANEAKNKIFYHFLSDNSMHLLILVVLCNIRSPSKGIMHLYSI